MGAADTIAVLGGHGFFGSLVVADLLAHGSERIRVAGRRPRAPFASERIEVRRCDQADRRSVEGLLEGTSLVVHAAGPYQGLTPLVAEAALDRGLPYVDLADDAAFVRRVHGLHERALRQGSPLLVGLSVVPGLSALLVEALRGRLEAVDSIRTFAAPGTRAPRGSATFASLLSGVGRPLTVPRAGARTTLRGWSEPEWIELPPPLGRRLTYLAIEVADLVLFPRLFGARTVEFRAAADQAWIGRLLAGVSRVAAWSGGPSLAGLGGPGRALVAVVSPAGTDAGAVLVEVAGPAAGRERRLRIAVLAEQGGGRIPAVPAALAARALLDGEVAAPGVVPLPSWIPTARLFRALEERGLEVWHDDGEGEGWRRGEPAGTIPA